jgi:integrase
MASHTLEQKLRRLYFRLPGEASRRRLWLGKMSAKSADTIVRHVEQILESKAYSTPLKGETREWLTTIKTDLRDKLAKNGLIDAESFAPNRTTLGSFVANYIAMRTDVKASTRKEMRRGEHYLVKFFGVDKPLAAITEGDAEDFRRWLMNLQVGREKATMAKATCQRICARAKQFMNYAKRKRLISESPFASMKDLLVHGNPDRRYYMDEEHTAAVFAALRDAKWRLVFALARYAGLRIPSEINNLRWSDFNWEAGTFVVNSPKTEHHAGRGTRVVPIFGELWEHLEAMKNDPAADPVFVFPHRRNAEGQISNLGTELDRQLKDAGVATWPKTFQNLRSSRQSELEQIAGEAAACSWLGNTSKVFREHYHTPLPELLARVTARPASCGNAAHRGATGDRGSPTGDKTGATHAVGQQAMATDDPEPPIENPGFHRGAQPDAVSRHHATADRSASSWTRTKNPLIKSQML